MAIHLHATRRILSAFASDNSFHLEQILQSDLCIMPMLGPYDLHACISVSSWSTAALAPPLLSLYGLVYVYENVVIVAVGQLQIHIGLFAGSCIIDCTRNTVHTFTFSRKSSARSGTKAWQPTSTRDFFSLTSLHRHDMFHITSPEQAVIQDQPTRP